jgi:ribosomal protein L11 methyltransferase
VETVSVEGCQPPFFEGVNLAEGGEMGWIEVSVEIDRESVETVIDVLYRYGYQGVAIEQEAFAIEPLEDEVPTAKRLIARAYFAKNDEAEGIKRQIEGDLSRLGTDHLIPAPQYAHIDEGDWWEAWKDSRFTVRVGRRIFICTPWFPKRAKPGEIVITLRYGAAFGTGTHPTTRLVLEAVEEVMVDWPGTAVLDLGCGSGILSIAAARMGATSVLALDIDPTASRMTSENAAINGVSDRITVQTGSLGNVLSAEMRFDVALVNIIGPVIVRLCSQNLGSVLRPGGIGIFSGIASHEIDKVEAALRSTGLEPYNRRMSGNWAAVETRRVQPPSG